MTVSVTDGTPFHGNVDGDSRKPIGQGIALYDDDDFGQSIASDDDDYGYDDDDFGISCCDIGDRVILVMVIYLKFTALWLRMALHQLVKIHSMSMIVWNT